MIVPTPCQVAKCKIDSDDGKDDAGDSNPLCESLLKQATNMKEAEVCANYEEKNFIQKILQCGGNIPKADEFTNELSNNDKKQQALDCSIRQPCTGNTNKQIENKQNEWKDGQMGKCLEDSKNKSHPYPADKCVSSARPLDCTTPNKQQYLCNVFKDALKENCDPTIPPTDFDECPKEKRWTTPAQLGDCLSKLQCKKKDSQERLKKDCVKKCYDDKQYDDIKNDQTQLDKLKNQLSACIAKADSNECPVTPTPGGNTDAPGQSTATPGQNTDAPAVSPATNTIKPADQGNDDQKPTSMGPKDQDVTSDEDEGCMVRANKKIIIAFAATFVVINFLKALPVEN